MPVPIIVPRLGWTMEEGGFVGWLKKDGEPVRSGEPLFTLDGDKALQDIEATDDGILCIPPNAPKPGSTVKVGSLLGYLLADNERAAHARSPAPAPVAPPPDSRPAPPERATKPVPPVADVVPSPRRSISPRALRVATEWKVDWSKLVGTGRGGRIREREVRAAIGNVATNTIPPLASARIVITDWTFPDLGIEEGMLHSLGHEVVGRQCRDEAELIELVADADCVITQFAKVNVNVIAAMARARVIVRYGIGVDNVDLEAARVLGIPVCNVPDYCIDEVADHTLGFILAATRQVVRHSNHVHAGQWGLAVPLAGLQALRDLTVGVAGFGRIGREVVKRLQPFKCRVLVFDPVVAAGEIERAGGQPCASVDELLVAADVLTLHCPSTARTRRMIDTVALAKLKPGALLINVARGDLVDTAALVAALECGHLGGAALDVCDPEPIPPDHPLLRLPNVIVAPHIASASPAAVRKLRETVAALAAAAARGEVPPNVVNGVTVPRAVA